MVDYITIPTGRLCVGDTYDGTVIESIFVHPESGSYWTVCKHDGGGYFERDIDNATGYGFHKSTCDLSGGSQW